MIIPLNKELFIDLNGKTYKLGKLIVTNQDFCQFPFIELFDANDYNCPCGQIPIYGISTRMCKPKSGIFDNPSHIQRTIIETMYNSEIKRLIVRTSKREAKGDMLDII